MPPRKPIKRHLRGIPRALFVLLVLTACGTAPPPDPAPPATVLPPPGETKIKVEPLPAEPAKAPVQAAPEPKPPQTAAAPPAPKPVDDNPNQLFGLSGQRVATLLGPANFVRRDGTAEVWQYRAPNCVLDVFLYRADDALSVAHVDLRQRRTATQPPRRCFAGLLEINR